MLAQDFMRKGMHVLQEHPVSHDEIVACLRIARQHRVVYRVNTHYIHLEPVQRFIAAARALCARQRPLFVEAVAGVQTAYSLFDIIGRALGGLRPWSFESGGPGPAASNDKAVFRSLEGLIAGVPVALRIQHQIAPTQPDNFVHLFHRVTIGTEGGTLTLANTHGPVLWAPRAHMPGDSALRPSMYESKAAHLDFPSCTVLGPHEAPPYRTILRHVWPQGVRNAIRQVLAARCDAVENRQQSQYELTLARAWQEAIAHLGPVTLLEAHTPTILPADVFGADTAAP